MALCRHILASHVKNLFEKIGYFNTNFKIAADFDWLLRLMIFKNLKFTV